MKTQPARISKEHLRELNLLKIAWEKHSIDEVLEILIAPHRVEKIKALGIEADERE